MKHKALFVILCSLSLTSIAQAVSPPRMARLECDTWLKENANGYIYMVEGYLLGLYRYQSLVGNPSGSFAMVSTKALPGQVREECQKSPQANVGDIANAIKVQLDLRYGAQ